MMKIIFLTKLYVSLILSVSGPPEEMIAFWLDLLGWLVLGLTVGVQILRKILERLDPDQIKGKLAEIFGKLGIVRDSGGIPNFDTLGVRQFIRNIQEFYRRILSSRPKDSFLLKQLFKFQRKIYQYLEKRLNRGGFD